MENIDFVDILLIPLLALASWIIILLFLWFKSKILTILLFPFVPITTLFISEKSFFTTLEFITWVVFGLAVILVIVSKILSKKYPSSVEKIDVHKYLELPNESVKELCSLYKSEEKLWQKQRYIKNLDLKKRKDGKFDERSKAGEDANEALEKIDAQLSYIYREKARICYKQELYEVWHLYISLGRYINNVMIACSVFILIISNYFLVIDQNEFLLKLLNEIYVGSNMRAFLSEEIVINLIPVGIFVLPLMFIVFLFGFVVSLVSTNENIFIPSVLRKHDHLMKIIENHNDESVSRINC